MDLTTEKIITFLPLDQEFKQKLLEKYPQLDADTRYMVGKIIWQAYYVLYELKVQENYQLALMKAEEDGVEPGEDFYQKIEEQTEKEIQNMSYGQVTSDELTQIRSKLQHLSGIQ